MEEIIRLRFEWQCPLCGHNNTGYAPLTSSWGNMDMQVIYCDNEGGGCDQQVAVAPRAHVTATTYKLVEASHRPDAPTFEVQSPERGNISSFSDDEF